MADDLSVVTATQTYENTAAVLFHPDALGPGYSWHDAIRLLRLALPGVRVIACHGFSESIDWPELCDAGAFHALWLPLKGNEVRQSLGFVLSRERRLSEAIPGMRSSQIQRMTFDRSLPARAAA
ncbi:MAG: hypothetical protein ABSG41_21230 [Bryobacteraceae bacterium]